MSRWNHNEAIEFAPSRVSEGVVPLHIRLCHSCLYLNESLTEIGQCRRCHTHLTFESFVEDLTPEELADLWMDQDLDDDPEVPKKSELRQYRVQGEQETIQEQSSQMLGQNEPPQILGLSVIW